MKQRLITSMFMVAAVLAILFLTEYIYGLVYDIFILLLMVTAGYEMSKAMANKVGKPLNFILFIYIALGYAAFRFVTYRFGRAGITAVFTIMGILVLVALVYNMFSEKKNLSNVISTVFCMVYPISIMIYLLALNYLNVGTPASSTGLAFTDWSYDAYPSGSFVPNYRAVAVMALLMCSCMTDTFAFFVGRALKGPKLAPSISPKKTISGAIGGFFGGLFGAGVILGVGYTGLLGLTPLSETVWVNIVLFIGLALGISFMTEMGDLIASYIKRYCEIKDYGTIFPGHGGILDRVDGIILSAVYVFAFFSVMQMIIEFL